MEKVMLNPERVKVLFGIKKDQADVLIAIYKMVFPEWDRIEKVGDEKLSWPVCNSWTYKKIVGWFMDFDRKFHPDVMNGGLWLQNGFSTDERYSKDLADWEVLRCPFTLKLR